LIFVLKSLIIKNYALIEDLNGSFDSGFTVITGETGAGKSILLSALDLVLGRRADTRVMRDANKKCIVEAHFELSAYHLAPVFEDLELDYDSTTILRREIWPSGKSRAFVNDSPVSLNQIKELKKYLVEIHHQGDTHNLDNQKVQLDFIDTIAGLEGLVQKYSLDYMNWRSATAQYDELLIRRQKSIQEADYQKFILDELSALNLDDLDQSALESSRNLAQNQEQVQHVINEVSGMINQEEMGLLDRLFLVRQRMNSIGSVSDYFLKLADRLDGLRIELQDIQSTLEAQLDHVHYEPEALIKMEQILDDLYRIQRKHGVDNVGELITMRDTLTQGIEDSGKLDDQITQLEHELTAMKDDLDQQAQCLFDKRTAILPDIESRLKRFFSELALPDAELNFKLERTPELNAFGGMSSSIEFSANKGIQLQPIEKVASGGEMSRVTLSFKAVIAEHQQLPTLIFDEIDTGISGDTAQKMAEILSQMSTRGQLFCLTHLPQTAAKGRFHKRIFKQISEGKTRTFIRDLDAQERVLEIAQMIGGHELTDSAKAHARQLLN
jgi:DNA repair protein RecN (Recombination protein N)